MNIASPAKFRDVDYPYAATVSLVLIAFLIRLSLDDLLESRSPLLIFIAAIVVAAGRYGARAGLLAMALGLMLGTAFFMDTGFPPRLITEDWANIGVFLVTGVAMLTFAGHLKTMRDRERELQSALQQVQTETAMGTMAATLAHELNQPLAAAANYVAAGKRMIAAGGGTVPPALVSGLDEAEAQIHRVGDIIRHARKLVSNRRGERSTASLRRMIDNAIKPLRASGQCRGIRFSVDIEPGSDALYVNAIQIEQVLLNLLRNACQESDPGGDHVDIKAKRDGELIEVEVRDYGPGISKDRLATLFSAAGQSTHGGLGLGLSISRTIVEAHGGRIRAQNHETGGASFLFTLPQSNSPS